MGAILVTGGAGFVGLNIVEALLARGEHVIVFGREKALPVAAEQVFRHLPGQLEVLAGDVCDRAALRRIFTTRSIDRLFPFAAITAGPGREATQASAVIETNLLGLIATLEAARDAGGLRRVVLPASGAVYGESAYTHSLLDEAGTPCVPISLYGTTKYAVERAGLRLCALWGLDAVVARIGATFGPWERDTGVRDTLSPHLSIARHALAGEEAVLPPSPPPAYDWVYVRDLAMGLLTLLDAKAPAERVFNIASGQDWSPHIDACCETLAAAMPGFRWRHATAGERPSVTFSETKPRGVMAIGRAAGLGWRPQYSAVGAYDDYAAWLLRVGRDGLG